MFSKESLIDQLGTVSYFKNMPSSTLQDIVSSGQLRYYAANSTIFNEGDPPDGMHVLLNGQVRLIKIGLQGIEWIIYILKSVVMFNEATVLDGKPNPITAVADNDVTTWQISTENFQKLLIRYPMMGFGLLRILSARNRILLARIEDMMSRSVLARTAKILIALSESDHQAINRYEHTNQRLAALAATVPEAISRSLQILRKEGIIETNRGQIKVRSRDDLLTYAQAEPIPLEYIHHS